MTSSSMKFERMTQEHRRKFVSTKGKQQKYFQQLQCQEQCIDHIPNLVPRAFPQKMGGAGKGPGIGWSRAKPKYS